MYDYADFDSIITKDPVAEIVTCDLFYKYGLILIPAWISSHMSNKAWDGITYPFPNFNGRTVEVWKWIGNFIPHFIMDVITYPRWD